MATKTKKTKIPADVMDCLPAEAKKALRTGGEWDGTPDSGGDCSQWYFLEDDEWVTRTYPAGYAVEGGKVYWRVMNCDSDGNWDFEDQAEVGTPECVKLEQEFGFDAWNKNYTEYLEWVAENGDDPVGEFFVKPTLTVEEKWRAQCYESILGVVGLMKAKKDGGRWVEPSNLPAELLEYLNAKAPDYVMGDFKTMDELEAVIAGSKDITKHPAVGWTSGAGRRAIVVEFTVKVSHPNPKYKAELIKKAKASLATRRFEGSK